MICSESAPNLTNLRQLILPSPAHIVYRKKVIYTGKIPIFIALFLLASFSTPYQQDSPEALP